MAGGENNDQRAVDRLLLLSTLALLALSILMVYSATAVVSQEQFGDATVLLRAHILHIFVGIGGFVFFTVCDPDRLRRLAIPLLFIGYAMLLLLLIPGVGHLAGGAQRWFALGPLRFQPGELVKLIFVIYFASYISRHNQQMLRFVPGTFVPCLLLMLAAGLLLLQPDFGSTVILLSVVFCQLLLASRLLHLAGVGLAGGCVLALLVFISPYRMQRVLSFLDPFSHPSSSGYQLIQSLIAVGSGGTTGAGLGAGKQKLFYLPAAHTDFIYAVIAEELGLAGGLAVLGVFLVIAYRGLSIAHRLSEDFFLSSLALGCTLLIVLPALLNMGVVLGLLPTKGMVLPLVAYGGTAMVVDLATMGVLVRLSRMREYGGPN